MTLTRTQTLTNTSTAILRNTDTDDRVAKNAKRITTANSHRQSALTPWK